MTSYQDVSGSAFDKKNLVLQGLKALFYCLVLNFYYNELFFLIYEVL